MTKQNIIGVGVLIVIALVIGFIETSKPQQSNIGAQEIVLDANERTTAKNALYERAKEITTPDGFINTEPFELADYIGNKVVLVEFWTYSCINCQRVIPYLNTWHTKYESDGLVIVGIHTPEFEFEKDYDNVVRAVEKYEVPWKVVLDNDYSTWRAYKNQYWPRKYLIDIDGYIVYDHIGEGAYNETEEKIVELLNERRAVLGEGGVVAVKDGTPDNVQQVDFQKVKTPETYLGSLRIQRLANLTDSQCLNGTCVYSFATKPLDGYELDGEWTITPEFSQNTGAASLRIPFTASKVNLVAGSDTPVRARILIDGSVVDSAQAGAAVVNGEVTFTDTDLYNLIDLNGAYETHILEIQFLDAGVEAFAFTFG